MIRVTIILPCLFAATINIAITHGFSFARNRPFLTSRSATPVFSSDCSTPCKFFIKIRTDRLKQPRGQNHLLLLFASLEENEKDTFSFSDIDKGLERRIIAASSDDDVVMGNLKQDRPPIVASNTVNARLLDELNNSIATNKNPEPKIKALKNIAGFFSSTRTEEERQLALEEAKDLNGVNPFACIAASVVCFVLAAGLWAATNFLTGLFVMHPIQTDIYAIQRFAAVFRNVIVGITSLGAGFSGVTGLGLAALGFRVAYGVYVTGELDPTPLPKNRSSTAIISSPVPRNDDTKEDAKFDARDAFALMFGSNKKRRSQK